MNILTKWLTALYKDSKLKIEFKTLPVEVYREKWEEIYPTCEKVKIPIFFSKNVDLGEMGQNLLSSYIEVIIENAGYKQPHEYLLTSVVRNNVNTNRILLSFASKFSNWGSKRVVIVSEDATKVYRNDFKDVYKLSWKDYEEGEYQKVKKPSVAPSVIKLRRPKINTLTENK